MKTLAFRLVLAGTCFVLAATAQAQPTAGLQLWLKADAISGLNNGDPVAAWPDASGFARDATNFVVANQPTYLAGVLNGLPVIRFADAANAANAGQYLDSGLALNANGAPFSAFAVFRSDLTATRRETILQPLNAGEVNNGRTVLYVDNDPAGQLKLQSFASETELRSARSYVPGTWAVVSLVQDPAAGTLALWRGGVLEASLPMGPFGTPNDLWRIGDNKPRTGGLQGDIAEILVYDAALSATDRAAVEDYLLFKYNLSAPTGAEPELLFRDTFDTSANSADVDFEISLRQSSSAGFLTYSDDSAGFDDLLSQVNNADSPGTLRLEANAARNYVSVSPNRNFTDGRSFALQFDLQAGLNDPGGSSGDWACVVFGATAPNSFVISADGFGILFRNNGDIQTFDAQTALYGGNGDYPGGMPLDTLHVRIEVETANFAGGSPATIRMFVNDIQTRLAVDSLEYVRPNGFAGNYLTLGGSAYNGANWVHTFDNLLVTAQPCIRLSLFSVNSYAGQTDQTVTVTIPPGLNALADVQVTVTSLNPAVAEPLGAVGGVLLLTFPAGGSASQDFTVGAHGKGYTGFTFAGPPGVCVGGALRVQVGASLVANPSFENDPAPVYPPNVGYTSVSSWNVLPGGGPGLNTAAGPFHDNGTIPDRAQVAFHQGVGGLSQFITGLIPGQPHWLQFRYNVRNCCGGVMNLDVRFGGQTLDSIQAIQPVGTGNPYRSRQIAFTPASSSGLLEFAANAVGDITLLLDAVTIVARGADQVPVFNPSFEASGDVPDPGTVSPAALSGWSFVGSGTVGINRSGAGPFANNGANPDQDHVAFINGPGSLSQVISNLVIGQEYKIICAVNAPSNSEPYLILSMAGEVLQELAVTGVGGNNPYLRLTNSWTATARSAELRFEQWEEFFDPVLLLDDIQVVGVALPPCEIMVSIPNAEFFDNQPLGGPDIMVTLPAYLVATQDVQVQITSLDPLVAVPEGGPDGALTLNFSMGGPDTLSFRINALSSGATSFTLSTPADCFSAEIQVRNRRSYVLNPSFEDNSLPDFPGYGQIASWVGGSGLNDATQPFADNGLIPDRAQVAFIQQGPRDLSQVIYGLDNTKQYWLQLHANARNCCEGAVPKASVRIDGDLIGDFPTVPPVGAGNPYYFVTLPFVPNGSSTEIIITGEVAVPGGDSTLLIDAVTVVQRDPGQIVFQNPSFEASGIPPSPGYLVGPMAGWAGSGQYGVNVSGQGPFADNGRNPDQDNVAFLQNLSSIAQTVFGLESAARYALSYAYNARGGDNPQLVLTVDGAVLHDVSVAPVGGDNPYHTHTVEFVASGDSATITFAQAAVGDGDETLLLDDLRLVLVGAPDIRLSIQPAEGDSVRLSWPMAIGDQWILQSSPTLPGEFTDVTWPVQDDGNEYFVYDSALEKQTFYRLRRP